MQQWRSAVDAIEQERVFRQDTDPLAVFPLAQLRESAVDLGRLLKVTGLGSCCWSG